MQFDQIVKRRSILIYYTQQENILLVFQILKDFLYLNWRVVNIPLYNCLSVYNVEKNYPLICAGHQKSIDRVENQLVYLRLKIHEHSHLFIVIKVPIIYFIVVWSKQQILCLIKHYLSPKTPIFFFFNYNLFKICQIPLNYSMTRAVQHVSFLI